MIRSGPLRPQRVRFRRRLDLPTAVCADSGLHCHTPPTFARAIPSGWEPERPGPPWSPALERRDRLEPKLRCGRSPPPPGTGETLPHGRTYEGTSVSEQLPPAAGRSSLRLSPRSGPLPSRACGTHRPVELTSPTEKNRPQAGLPFTPIGWHFSSRLSVRALRPGLLPPSVLRPIPTLFIASAPLCCSCLSARGR